MKTYSFILIVVILFLRSSSTTPAASTDCKVSFTPKDVVAFIGGADVAAAQTTGHTESLLAAFFPGTAFRNLGWEGDTVYAQPRDHGFPPLKQHLQKHGATAIFIQYGRMESLDGPSRIFDFEKAYQAFLDDLKVLNAKLILITPPPFEKKSGPFPDLSARGGDLQKYAERIKNIAERNGLACIDLFFEMSNLHKTKEVVSVQESGLTDNGLQFTATGHAVIARALAKQLRCGESVKLPSISNNNAAWDQPQLEKLRQAIIEKNVLWTYYWRPHNWAFLGGDRITQPSSRDHLNPSARWFPAEMEKFVPLIRDKEEEITRLATPSLQQRQ